MSRGRSEQDVDLGEQIILVAEILDHMIRRDGLGFRLVRRQQQTTGTRQVDYFAAQLMDDRDLVGIAYIVGDDVRMSAHLTTPCADPDVRIDQLSAELMARSCMNCRGVLPPSKSRSGISLALP